MLTLLVLGRAFADDTPAPAPAPVEVAAETTAAPKQRQFLMEVNARGRYLFLPDSILDIWYEKHQGESIERPQIAAYAIGLEYVIRDDQANGIFYLEYMPLLTQEGYWDDRDNPPVYTDGSFVDPQGFGIVAFGANYAYEIRATDWLSFMTGAGLGVGVKTGNLIEWEPGEPEGTPDGDNTDPDCLPTGTAYERYEGGCADDGPVRVPPVIPIVDVNVGVRFNFSDKASLRVEGGLHDLLYGGAALGITF